MSNVNNFSGEYNVSVENTIDWFIKGCPDIIEMRPVKVVLDPKPRRSSNSKVYSYNGFTGTLSDICKKFNVKYSVVYSRMSRGFSLEDAIKGNMKPSRKPKIYEYHGFSGTLKELCEHFSINFSTASNKVSRGKSIEEVVHEGLRTAVKKNKSKSNDLVIETENGYLYNGMQVSLRSLCEIHGLKYGTVLRRLDSGMSINEAISRVPSSDRVFTVNGVSGNLSDLAKHFNVSIATVYGRLDRGFTLEEALETPIPFRTYNVEGVEGNLGKICLHFGLNYNTVLMKLRRGSTIDEAVEFARRKMSV